MLKHRSRIPRAHPRRPILHHLLLKLIINLLLACLRLQLRIVRDLKVIIPLLFITEFLLLKVLKCSYLLLQADSPIVVEIETTPISIEPRRATEVLGFSRIG